MKKTLILALVLMFAALGFAQLSLTSPIQQYESYGQGVYSAPAYNYVTRVLGGGATAGGTFSITLYSSAITLPDGRRVAIFGNTTLPPITIGQGATLETVTPSSASNCSTVNTGVGSFQGATPCTLTATFTNAHGAGDLVQSGDYGIQEAINDAGNNGGGMVFWEIPSGAANKTDFNPDPVTLATGAAATNMSAVKIPVHSTVMGAVARITTTVTSCSSGWTLGWAGSTAAMRAADTTLTAGTTTDTTATIAASSAVAFNLAAVVPIVNCTGSNAGAGAMKTLFYGYKHAPGTF
jgi:hypothetical protein